jgi:hypothetical protein
MAKVTFRSQPWLAKWHTWWFPSMLSFTEVGRSVRLSSQAPAVSTPKFVRGPLASPARLCLGLAVLQEPRAPARESRVVRIAQTRSWCGRLIRIRDQRHSLVSSSALFTILRRAYHVRSAIVHGGKPENVSLPAGQGVTLRDFTFLLKDIVRTLLRKSIILTVRGEADTGSGSAWFRRGKSDLV